MTPAHYVLCTFWSVPEKVNYVNRNIGRSLKTCGNNFVNILLTSSAVMLFCLKEIKIRQKSFVRTIYACLNWSMLNYMQAFVSLNLNRPVARIEWRRCGTSKKVGILDPKCGLFEPITFQQKPNFDPFSSLYLADLRGSLGCVSEYFFVHPVPNL